MNSRILILLIILISVFSSPLLARGKPEVEQLITEVRQMISDFPGNVDMYASKEKEEIFRLIEASNKLLEENSVDEAYYQISIAKYYFNLINAQKELYNAKQEEMEVRKKIEKNP